MHLARNWKTPRVVLGLFIFEFAVTIPALALFGIAAPNTYRTSLWKDGGVNGFNSDPIQVLYAYANYQPIPKTPLVWSQFITNWNVTISVLSMFILLIKAVLHVMHLFYPLLSLIIHCILAAIWAVAIHGQAGADNSDPKHPSSTPWYLTKSCSVAHETRNVGYCKQAKSAFAVSVIMLAIFAIHLPLAVVSLFPGRRTKHSRNASTASEASMTKASPDSDISNDKSWELGAVPRTPARTPATPRTLAFNTLSSNRGTEEGRRTLPEIDTGQR